MSTPDTADLAAIRQNLVSLKAWIEHWQADVASDLKPTPSSLASAHTLATISIAALDRIGRIAAVPDMHEALYQCLGSLKALGAENGFASEAARAAIAKAEGRA